MFRRILIPTGGSAASMVAVDAAIGLARGGGTRVVGLHVTPCLAVPNQGSTVAAPCQADGLARQIPGYVTRRADAPSEAVLAAAREFHCDLIVMATHGRGTDHAAPPGSQTTAVPSHSGIPVPVVPPSYTLTS